MSKDLTLAVEEPTAADMLAILEGLAVGDAITPVALNLTDSTLTFERYEAIGRMLGAMGRSVRWWVGDWLVFGDAVYGELMAQAVGATGLAETTLLNYRWVAERVPKSRRRHEVSFSCHTEVAPLKAAQQKKWLAVASREQLTQRELRARIRDSGDMPENGSAGGSRTVGAGRASAELEKIARDIWTQAQPDHEGYYRVPGEVMARLAAAIGEGE